MTKIDDKFVTKVKTYFSSISDRGAMYAYVNLAPRTVVLCNSSSTSTLTGDRLMNFAVGTLALHALCFKDDDFWNTFNNLIPFSKLSGIGVLYLNKLLKWLSMTDKLDKLVFVVDGNVLKCGFKNTLLKQDDNIVGEAVLNFHIAREVSRWYHVMTEFKPTSDNMCLTDTFILEKPQGRLSYFNVELSKFHHEDGTPVFQQVYDRARLLLSNGLTTVSYNFIAKIKREKIPYTLTYTLWVEDNNYLRMMTNFDNEVVHVISYRPNVLMLPIPLDIPRDPYVE